MHRYTFTQEFKLIHKKFLLLKNYEKNKVHEQKTLFVKSENEMSKAEYKGFHKRNNKNTSQRR